MSLTSKLIRTQFKLSDDIRDAGLTTPADIRRYDDIAYGPEDRWQRLDVYRPKASENAVLPVIVSVHGGGWVYGDKERYQFYCMNLAQRGFAVVNFTYRLAPEYKYPAAMEDADRVFHWVLDHAGEYGFDARHVFAVGDSAGAHMLAIYCCICTNPDYARRYAFRPPEGFVPTAVALNCGVYRVGDDKGQTSKLMADLLPGGGTPEEFDTLSPIRHINAAFPPAFVMTCDGDFLKAQGPELSARLETLGVQHVSRLYGDGNPELPHVFHCNIKTDAARICNDEECAFFRRFL